MKKKQVNKDDKVVQNNNTIVEKAVDTVKYSGDVNIIVKNNKKVISKSNYHNSGKENLFKFIAMCLAGDFTSADAYRPIKIKFFYNKGTDVATARENINKWENIKSMSQFIWMDATPVYADADNKTKYITTLHFRIPFSLISTGEINQACIYGRDVSTESDYSACYLFTKTNSRTGAEELDPIDTSSYGQNYNIIIEWKLSVSNK